MNSFSPLLAKDASHAHTESPDAPAQDTSAKAWARAMESVGALLRAGRTFGQILDGLAETYEDQIALSDETSVLTYGALAERARRYTRWAHGLDCRAAGVVGLLAPNGPDYLAGWMGVSRSGHATALLNPHLPAPSLAHSLSAAKVQWLIYHVRYHATVLAACALLDNPPELWPLGAGEEKLDQALARLSGAPFASEARAVALSETALYIFTSGTTGLPKAARVSHRRVLSWAGWFAGLANIQATDVMYDCLPLFHSVGGVVAAGSVLLRGGRVVLRQGFSARKFWDDVRAEGCTLVQYIGEMCRYLLAAPRSDRDGDHGLRLMIGNGLRPEIWSDFQARFALPRIVEFYAATEGTFSLYNVEGRPGVLGRFPPLLQRRPPAVLVQVDPETLRISRDADGRGVLCSHGEVGEALGRIDPSHPFEGYADGAATEAKLMRDLFEAGDAWFRTGDLMRQDRQGYFSFVDRIGDTFRWKGENVATTEVAQALAAVPGIVEAAVYGVQIPGRDGRAGMAAIVADDSFDPDALGAVLRQTLPAYAQPVFVKRVRALAHTDTFKVRTVDHQKLGFDPKTSEGELFWRHPSLQSYQRLDSAVYAKILNGEQAL